MVKRGQGESLTSLDVLGISRWPAVGHGAAGGGGGGSGSGNAMGVEKGRSVRHHDEFTPSSGIPSQQYPHPHST